MKTTNIQRFILRGSKELEEATGYGKRVHAVWRQQGMPHYFDGKHFLYDPDEVKRFLKNFYKIAEK